MATHSSYAITNVKVFDGETVIDASTVTVVDGETFAVVGTCPGGVGGSRVNDRWRSGCTLLVEL